MFLFSIYAWVWFFGDFCRILDHLTQKLTLIWVLIFPPLRYPKPYVRETREEQKISELVRNHGQPVVSSTDHGEPITANRFIILYYAGEDPPFATYKGMFQGLRKRIQHPSPSHYFSHIHLSFS